MTKKKKIDTLRIIVLGVLPEYRSTGADAALYYEFFERGSKRGIKFGEASWILEDNLMMNRALTVTMNGKKYKTYRLYDKAL
jgi:ribosomal protein S18 acetylase RimI-like enzyme